MTTRTALRRESEEDRKARLDAEEKAQLKRAELAKDLNETFATGHGRRTLRYLMGLCGYQNPSVVADPATGEIQTQSTVYNEARRNLYLTLRKHLSKETLTAVEIDPPEGGE